MIVTFLFSSSNPGLHLLSFSSRNSIGNTKYEIKNSHFTKNQIDRENMLN
jgi:hypothetical protein